MKSRLINTFLGLTTFVFLGFKLNAQTQWNTFTTSYGNIQLGPADANYGHIYTDRSKFLFNKDLYLLTGGISSYSGVGLSFKTNGGTRMFVNYSTGFVGVGTTNPIERLHVLGNILVPADNFLKFGTENNNTGALTIVNATCCYNSYINYDGNLFFRRMNHSGANQGAIMGLQNDGTVTIGVWEKYDNTVTDTQGARLMVNGGILCEKVKVIADVPNSDFVFEPTYKLMPLTELRDFVLVNRHLPEIPSAQEFQDNGYSLGQMDDLLLRKVEELTLYILQLEEQLKAQQEQIDVLIKK